MADRIVEKIQDLSDEAFANVIEGWFRALNHRISMEERETRAKPVLDEMQRRLRARHEPPNIKVERGRVPFDPVLDVFHVEIEMGGSEWTESFANENETRAFLRGVVAGSHMLGAMNVVEPDIPEWPTVSFSSEHLDELDLGEDIPF